MIAVMLDLKVRRFLLGALWYLCACSGPVLAQVPNYDRPPPSNPPPPLQEDDPQPSAASPGDSFDVHNTVRYIFDKYKEIAWFPEQWWRITYKNPWLVFEWKLLRDLDDTPTTYTKYSVDLGKVRGATCGPAAPEVWTNGRLNTIVVGKISVTCDAGLSCAKRYSDGAEHDVSDVPLDIWIGKCDELANAIAHLASLHPRAPRDPFASPGK